MEPRLSAITLGVTDLTRTRRFYVEGLGWTPACEIEDVLLVQAGPMVVAFHSGLADEAGVSGESRATTGTFALVQYLRERDGVDALLARAEREGARITRPATDTDWGSRFGYFADPDGHLWQVGFDPAFLVDDEGRTRFVLPEPA